ncbi:PLC-like phosphodiesterase [Gigaspora rosea]|uniref:PLC-like phosphodiesterase n=1 Tax=Gigaspora rosea TaxID=44941 RepID=A0A397UNU2_9GLOM|nr:PLC-like phosphodiesterase [Gigaspora rosea]
MKLSLFILFIAVISFPSAKAQSTPTVCNGYAEFCNKPYSSISFVATHNSYAYGGVPAINQFFDISTQLKDGIRVFLLDGHNSTKGTSDIELCHTDCTLLDTGTAANTLKIITSFLQNNPNEVITIFWENYDKIDPLRYKAEYDKAGLTQYCRTQPVGSPWPTMASIIQSGQRVINFIDTNANTATVPWLMPQYSYVFETPFQNSDPNAWQCTVDRPKNQPQPMYMVNHFLYTIIQGLSTIEVPKPQTAASTNSDNLNNHVQNCTNIFDDKIPNFVAVDFYDQGQNNVNAFSVVAGLNKVSYTPQNYGNGTNPLGGGGGSTGNKKNSASDLKVNGIFSAGIALAGVAIFIIIGL